MSNATTMSNAASRDADAVRYIVLRKLASGLRHTLMGELQSVQFLAELGARNIDNGADQSRTRDCIGKISQATSEAIATCHSVIAWLRPEEGATTTLGEAVEQCVKLAGDDWRMRATRATVEMPGAAGEAKVSRAAARELVVTSLLALTDQHPGSLDIEVVGALAGDRVDLRLRALASKRVAPLPASIIYHALGWDEVAVLAAAHGVLCDCKGDAATLRFAVLPPAPS
jgi:hypothetical protein